MAIAGRAPGAKHVLNVGASTWDNAVRLWLLTIVALVLAMITVGGATRLTDSGLSITEWQPLLGAIPPLSEAHWLEAFAKYKEIPEYHLVNQGMSLEDFKVIYWWEWSHRFLGRIIGLAFAIPLIVFWLKRALRPELTKKLAGVLALGAVQGGIGWFMVKSGLVDRVDVSQYRLALHLTVAFLILALVVWLAFDLGKPDLAAPRPTDIARRSGVALLTLTMLQVVLGAFVAGLKAGLIYNTWPAMDGAFLPHDYLAMQPWYVNFFENPAAAQFNHRLVAYAVAALAAVNVWSIFQEARSSRLAASSIVLMVAVLAQIALGIATLLNAVPLGLGIAHQAAAALLVIVITRHVHILRTDGKS